MEIKVTPRCGRSTRKKEEYARIQKILAAIEHHGAGIFSVMWSEHCSYKSSKCT